MGRPYIIAEMGVNFYDTARALGIAPLEAAKLYIDRAAEAGIDCAKFSPTRRGPLSQRIPPRTGTRQRSRRKRSMSCF